MKTLPSRTSLGSRSLVVALLAFIAGSWACGSTSDAPGPDTDAQFQALDEAICLTKAESDYGVANDSKLARDVDFLGAYEIERFPPGGDPKLGKVVATPLSIGTACARASDKGACGALLARMTELVDVSGWSASCTGLNCGPSPMNIRQVRVTRGDEVVVVKSATEASTFMFPIDTAREAVARVAALGTLGVVLCERPNVHHETDGSYTVRMREEDCRQGDVIARLVRVASNGTVSTVREYRLRPSAGEPTHCDPSASP